MGCEHVWQGADKVVIKNGRPQLIMQSVCFFCGQVRRESEESMIVPVCDQCNGKIIPESLQRWPYVPLHVSTKSILCEDGNSCESIHEMRIEDDR